MHHRSFVTSTLALLLLGACQGGNDLVPEDVPKARPIEGLTPQYVVEDGILSTGQPSDAQLAEAAAKGYRTVINLRRNEESPDVPKERGKVEDLGMRYVHIPTGGSELRAEDADRLAEVLSDPASYPVLLHCSGANRTGGLFAITRARVENLDVTEAIQVGKEAGMRKPETIGAVQNALTDPLERR